MALAAVCVYTSFHMCLYIPTYCRQDTQSAVLMLPFFKSHTPTQTHMQVMFVAGLDPGKCF